MDVAKEEIVKTEELETRYERYKGILKDLTIMSDVFTNLYKCLRRRRGNTSILILPCRRSRYRLCFLLF